VPQRFLTWDKAGATLGAGQTVTPWVSCRLPRRTAPKCDRTRSCCRPGRAASWTAARCRIGDPRPREPVVAAGSGRRPAGV